MIQRDRLIKLFDIYNNLLTDTQKEYFKCYYFEDLSLSEISENFFVSKAAVAKTIKIIENKLESLETSLKILQKNQIIENILPLINEDKIKKELEKALN